MIRLQCHPERSERSELSRRRDGTPLALRLRRFAPSLSMTSVALGVAIFFGLVAMQKSAPAAPAGKSVQRTLTVDGMARTYLVYHPAGVGANAPLVVMLHGGFGTGAQIEDHTHWDAKAEAGKFVAAFPDGYHNGWAWGGCCGNGQRPDESAPVDDVKFLTAMVQEIEATDRVD